MNHGISGVELVTLRVAGAAVLFWLASLFTKRERVPGRDLVRLFFAGLLGLVFNQCCYIIGLGITSPINASIVTTSAPIFAMVLSAIILKEPVTGKKATGVLLGFSGALILVLGSASASSSKEGNLGGDLLCLFAQFSFALYLALFRPLVQRYSVFTVNKWMFTFAAAAVLPFTAGRLADVDLAATPPSAWLEAAYVVVVGTFLCYILMMTGQRTLRPTVVSIYNYLQPVVSVVVSVVAGLGVFSQATPWPSRSCSPACGSSPSRRAAPTWRGRPVSGKLSLQRLRLLTARPVWHSQTGLVASPNGPFGAPLRRVF